MAAIASPTWAEAQAMDPIERSAFNIVRGEVNGDEFWWDAEWFDSDGKIQVGGWKSQIESKLVGS